MTVREMLSVKYLNALKTMNATTWKNIQNQPKHPAEIMYRGLEITENDIRENGGYNGSLWTEIKEMHEKKLLASNKHRQYHGMVTKYWLTDKGWNVINKDHAIC